MRSKLEERIAASLRDRGVGFNYESYSYDYYSRVRSGHCPSCDSTEVYQRRWYTPDFFLKNGVIVEAKGKFDPKQRARFEGLVKAHPDKDIRIVFQRDNKLKKGGDKRYSDWCEEKGVKYAIGDIPDEWTSEDDG